jgi:hypothetical protein
LYEFVLLVLECLFRVMDAKGTQFEHPTMLSAHFRRTGDVARNIEAQHTVQEQLHPIAILETKTLLHEFGIAHQGTECRRACRCSHTGGAAGRSQTA